MKLILLIFAGCWGLVSYSATPLPASEVFTVTVTQNPHNAVLQWTIKKGYYLYKNTIRIKSTNPQHLRIETIEFPKTEEMHRSRQKEIPVYTGSASVIVHTKFLRNEDSSLLVQYQGCSAIGYCYPPQQETILLKRPL